MEKQIDKITVRRLLISLGITPKSNGYKYLTSAILKKLAARPADIPMFKLCGLIAAEYGVTASSVERCMRFAVTRTYDLNKLSGINDLYNFYVINDSPTLSDFIMYLVEYFDSFYHYDDYNVGLI